MSEGSAQVRFVLESSASPNSAVLFAAFVADIGERYPGWTPADSGRADPDAFSPPSGAWFVGYVAGKPVACGGLKQIEPDMAEVRRVFVQPTSRGGGVGRALLATLIEQAHALGYKRVCLDTGDHQPEALGLFRNAGFLEAAPFNANPFASHWLKRDV